VPASQILPPPDKVAGPLGTLVRHPILAPTAPPTLAFFVVRDPVETKLTPIAHKCLKWPPSFRSEHPPHRKKRASVSTLIISTSPFYAYAPSIPWGDPMASVALAPMLQPTGKVKHTRRRERLSCSECTKRRQVRLKLRADVARGRGTDGDSVFLMLEMRPATTLLELYTPACATLVRARAVLRAPPSRPRCGSSGSSSGGIEHRQ
jgi:hypothetical protein